MPLIQRRTSLVTQEAQRKLATWLAKIAMVGDANNPDKCVVSQDHRTIMRMRQMPPDGWEVWIGTYGGVIWRELGIWQHSGQLNLPVENYHSMSGYMMATTMGLGSLFVLVLGTGISEIGFGIGSAASILKRIWPTTSAFGWPLDHVLSDDEAGAIANIIATMTAHPIGIQIR